MTDDEHEECRLGGECPCAHHYGMHGSDLDDARKERDEWKARALMARREAYDDVLGWIASMRATFVGLRPVGWLGALDEMEIHVKASRERGGLAFDHSMSGMERELREAQEEISRLHSDHARAVSQSDVPRPGGSIMLQRFKQIGDCSKGTCVGYDKAWGEAREEAAELRDSLARLVKRFESYGVSLGAQDKLDRIARLLEVHGCDCACDHRADEHDADCAVCFPCRISEVLL